MTWGRASNQHKAITEEIILKCNESNTHKRQKILKIMKTKFG